MPWWTCPHCSGQMYSAYEYPHEALAKCEYCGREFENPFYREAVK